MMTFFCKTDSVWQISLLILSQFTIFTFVSGIIFLYKRGCKFFKIIIFTALFLLNTILYIFMQLDSRLTEAGEGPCLQIPYAVFLFIVLASLFYNILTLISETKNRKTINHNSIKEAFDDLSTGVCFFNEAGLPVLCNPTMHRLSFAISGTDIQFISEIDEWLCDEFIPIEGVKKDKGNFILKTGDIWRIKKRSFSDENSNLYTQYTATDITELYKNREKLTLENKQLKKVQTDLQKLSANVVTITREEEILNTKMRVHDEMGRCLIAAQKYLKEENFDSIPDDIASSWQKAVSMIKYSNDAPDEDMLLQIRKTCEFIKLEFLQTGELPKSEKLAYILTCAVRECVTNAARYAEATQLYAVFSENDKEASVVITNNGNPPQSEISEGGGLSSLRHRVERAGGCMRVQSFPEFKLCVTVPKEGEEIV